MASPCVSVSFISCHNLLLSPHLPQLYIRPDFTPCYVWIVQSTSVLAGNYLKFATQCITLPVCSLLGSRSPTVCSSFPSTASPPNQRNLPFHPSGHASPAVHSPHSASSTLQHLLTLFISNARYNKSFKPFSLSVCAAFGLCQTLITYHF